MSAEEKIKITYYTPIDDSRSQVIALFGCYAVKDDIYFSKMKLIKKSSGEMFIAFPSEKFTNKKTGQDEYSNFCWYGKRKAQLFQEIALESIKEYQKRKGIGSVSIFDSESNKDDSSQSQYNNYDPNQVYFGF